MKSEEKHSFRWRRLAGKRLTAMALALLLMLLLLSPLSEGIRAGAVDAPKSDNIFIYNNTGSYTSMVYVLTEAGDEASAFRVYQDRSGTVLLGEAAQDLHEGYCAIRLSEYMASANVYVTRVTEEGESRPVTVSGTSGVNPTVMMNMRQVDAAKKLDASGFLGDYVRGRGQLRAGDFYMVEVRLLQFTAIDSVTIPLRYDPALLEPASVTTGSMVTQNTAANLDAAAQGTTFNVPTTRSHSYGILPGTDFSRWKNTKTNESGSFSASTAGGSYQYINTNTGLIKLSAGIGTPTAFGTGSYTQFVRFFFRAKEDVTLTGSLPVWFATEADCPDSAIDSDTLRVMYFDPASPNGIFPALGGANVMTIPPTLQPTDAYTEEDPLQLTVHDLDGLPESYFSALSARTLQTDEVEIYNYTNYTASGNSTGTLDEDLEDRMLIRESVFIYPRDTVRVYLSDGTGYRKIAEGQANGEGQVDLSLGTGNLLPEGGTVYVTTARQGQGESVKVPVPYPREVSRDVYFKIYRSGWEDDHPVEAYTAGSLRDVKLGEQLQLRIYFNNFYDLMSYGFAVHYDPQVVQAATMTYEPLTTGTVQEAQFKAGESCFFVGRDLSNVTLTEQVVYNTWERLKKAQEAGDTAETVVVETEIEQIISRLALADRTAFERLAMDVAVKYTIGVSDERVPWKGGLLFTGSEHRDDPSTYPYVNNEAGYLQLYSASLAKPPLTLEREGGYHFLTINFVAKSYGDPDFRLATDLDDAYCEALPKGKQAVLVGGGYNVGITEHWEVCPMGSQPEITLLQGNACLSDLQSYAVYLYNGAAYRDPGFVAAMPNGMTVPEEDVRRYYVDDTGQEVQLPVYSEEETLDLFAVRGNKYSDAYRLIYEYVTPDGKYSCQAVRDIYIIFRKGDVNRDGEIDLFDEQVIANHFNGTAALDISDDLYLMKTVDIDHSGGFSEEDRTALHEVLMGYRQLEQDYEMPVEEKPKEESVGGTESPAMRLHLDVYNLDSLTSAPPPDTARIDPTSLSVGQKIAVVIRTENLNAITENGLESLAVSIGYDPTCFELEGFSLPVYDETVSWTDAGKSFNQAWLAAPLSAGYTADASDRLVNRETGRRRVYFQYLAESGRSDDAIYSQSDGVVAVCAFEVKKEFTKEDGIELSWEDYAFSAYQSVSHTAGQTSPFNRRALTAHPNFIRPANVLTATGKGHTISGVVVSYNAKNPVYYELYKMGSDGNYLETPIYAGIAIEAAETTTASRQTQNFTIAGVADGTYKLRIKKPVHLTYTIIGVQISGTDVSLSDVGFNENIRTISLAAGDVDGNGAVNVNDTGRVTHPANYNKTDLTSALNPEADIDGNGAINVSDRSIVVYPDNYNKQESDFVFTV